jgi:hypothetical protein
VGTYRGGGGAIGLGVFSFVGPVWAERESTV